MNKKPRSSRLIVILTALSVILTLKQAHAQDNFNICYLCFGVGKVACSSCHGKTTQGVDDNGLPVFCSKCVCKYCDKEDIGTGTCPACDGKGYWKTKLAPRKQNGANQNMILDAIAMAGYALVIAEKGKTLKSYKENYYRANRRIRDYEERQKEKAKIATDNLPKYGLDDLKKYRRNLTTDYWDYLGSLKVSSGLRLTALFDAWHKKKKRIIKNKSVEILSDDVLLVTPNSKLSARVYLKSKAAISTTSFKDSVAFYGQPYYVVILSKFDKHKKEFEKKYFSSIPSKSVFHDYTRELSEHELSRLQKDDFENRYRNSSYHWIFSFANKNELEEGGIYKFEIYGGSKRPQDFRYNYILKNAMYQKLIFVQSLKAFNKTIKKFSHYNNSKNYIPSYIGSKNQTIDVQNVQSQYKVIKLLPYYKD
ncbi:DnaJ-like cysteine-rich domain-containing protein [Flavivirga algicola]|uniref:Uncharacterized protein n=1 Tax=Flavivirga algicola TaxID=2729136 RepID=A0ABX1S3U8_9FLAO|nr:hypothetical protein [Flavivirga algicola]NMH89568.1 hypothetical protein [Flavivirga algicola]